MEALGSSPKHFTLYYKHEVKLRLGWFQAHLANSQRISQDSFVHSEHHFRPSCAHFSRCEFSVNYQIVAKAIWSMISSKSICFQLSHTPSTTSNDFGLAKLVPIPSARPIVCTSSSCTVHTATQLL